jgi:hypothetical protein
MGVLMSKEQVKDFVLLMFWGTLGCLFLYWILTYKPSGDFFKLDEPVKKIQQKRFKALAESFKG